MEAEKHASRLRLFYKPEHILTFRYIHSKVYYIT